jgi:hypothetical protein
MGNIQNIPSSQTYRTATLLQNSTEANPRTSVESMKTNPQYVRQCDETQMPVGALYVKDKRVIRSTASEVYTPHRRAQEPWTFWEAQDQHLSGQIYIEEYFQTPPTSSLIPATIAKRVEVYENFQFKNIAS